jgi:hypothetical protein
MHCFVNCAQSQSLWLWLLKLLSPGIQWVSTLSDAELLFGFTERHNTDKHVIIWKLFHAETIRVIWYSRCRKHFDNEILHIEALKALIKNRCQVAFSIYEADPHTKKDSLIVWRNAFTDSTMKNGRIRLNV